MESTSRTDIIRQAGPHPRRLSSILSGWVSRLLKWLSRAPTDASVETAPPIETSQSITVVDLVRQTDALLLLEARHGCVGHVDDVLEQIKSILRTSIILPPESDAEKGAIEQLWINFLRLGMLDELLGLIRSTDLPIPGEIRRFLEYC